MSESNRISQLLSRMRQSSLQTTIRHAKVISKPCNGPTCSEISGNNLNETPLESDLLAYNVATKMIKVQGTSVSSESARIQNVMISTINYATNEFNPVNKFAQYAPRVVLPVCPPVPLIDRNANLPKGSTKCPLPNKPYLPSQY